MRDLHCAIRVEVIEQLGIYIAKPVEAIEQCAVSNLNRAYHAEVIKSGGIFITQFLLRPLNSKRSLSRYTSLRSLSREGSLSRYTCLDL